MACSVKAGRAIFFYQRELEVNGALAKFNQNLSDCRLAADSMSGYCEHESLGFDAVCALAAKANMSANLVSR